MNREELKNRVDSWEREYHYLSNRITNGKQTEEENLKMQGTMEGMLYCINDMTMYLKYNP